MSQYIGYGKYFHSLACGQDGSPEGTSWHVLELAGVWLSTLLTCAFSCQEHVTCVNDIIAVC